MKTLGLVMLTHNEEEFIADSLGTIVPYVDEAIVIDQYSTDNTVRIAESLGARVVLVEGNFLSRGEKYFRDLAARICSCDWMMTADADEVMTDNWAGPLRFLLNECEDEFGTIEVPFYHLMGSYEFHAINSPLWRAEFVRRHPLLCGCPPKEGTQVHSNYYLSYEPNVVKRWNKAAVFHLGYVQRNLMKRWATNIRRGDYGHTLAQAVAELDRIQKNPCEPFPECTPLDLPLEKYPAILQPRVGRTYRIDYDHATRRILNRTPISA